MSVPGNYIVQSKVQSNSQNTLTANKFYFAVITLSSLLFFAFCIYSPDQNWDMLGYSASAISLENNDPEFIHNYIYSELESYASDSELTKLTAGNDYAVAMHQDANAFYQQIPYYKIRIVFVGLTYMLTKIGINIFSAAHMITAAAGSLGLMLFFYAYRKYIKPSFWLLTPFFFVLCGAFDTSQYVTADTLAFLWIGAICFSFIRQHWSVFPIIAAAVLIRTDMAVFVALALTYIFFFWPGARMRAFITAIVAGILYVSVNKLMGNYGWSTVFYFVFISDMSATHPAVFSQLGISAQQYIYEIIANLVWVFYETEFWVFISYVLVQCLLFYNFIENNLSIKEKLVRCASDPIISLTIISCAYIFLHYLLFPTMWTRFFIGQYMIGALGLLYTITLLLNNKADPLSAEELT